MKKRAKRRKQQDVIGRMDYMIIRKDGSYETNSMFLNTDWYNEGNHIIDEVTEVGMLMAQIYIKNYPFVDFEYDGKFITDVIVLDKPEKPEEIEGKFIELIKNEQDDWEYIYVDIPKTETEIQENIINTLGQELAMLKLQFMMGGM